MKSFNNPKISLNDANAGPRAWGVALRNRTDYS